jgi:hypothetical protein
MSAAQRRLLAVSLALGAGAACTPVESAPDAGVDTVDAGADVTDGGVEDLSRSPDCDTSIPWVTEVSGQTVDEAGAGFADVVVQLCVRTNEAQLLCLRPSTSGDEGAFTVDVAANARCMERATARVIKPLTNNATLYCSVPLTTEASSIVLEAPYTLVSTTPATGLPAVGDEAAVRAVGFAGGLSLDVAPSTLPNGTYERLAARVIDDVAAAPACLRVDAPAMSSMVGFSPELDVSGAGLTARLPNSGALAAGTTVPVYALGSIDCRRADGTLLEEGHWDHFADGVVTPDGTSIEVAGVPCLTWLGVGTPQTG